MVIVATPLLVLKRMASKVLIDFPDRLHWIGMVEIAAGSDKCINSDHARAFAPDPRRVDCEFRKIGRGQDHITDANRRTNQRIDVGRWLPAKSLQ